MESPPYTCTPGMCEPHPGHFPMSVFRGELLDRAFLRPRQRPLPWSRGKTPRSDPRAHHDRNTWRAYALGPCSKPRASQWYESSALGRGGFVCKFHGHITSPRSPHIGEVSRVNSAGKSHVITSKPPFLRVNPRENIRLGIPRLMRTQSIFLRV